MYINREPGKEKERRKKQTATQQQQSGTEERNLSKINAKNMFSHLMDENVSPNVWNEVGDNLENRGIIC